MTFVSQHLFPSSQFCLREREDQKVGSNGICPLDIAPLMAHAPTNRCVLQGHVLQNVHPQENSKYFWVAVG